MPASKQRATLIKPQLRFLLIGAAVLVVVALLWAGLTTALAWGFHWGAAPLIALVIIVVVGWAANGFLLWRQVNRKRPPLG